MPRGLSSYGSVNPRLSERDSQPAAIFVPLAWCVGVSERGGSGDDEGELDTKRGG